MSLLICLWILSLITLILSAPHYRHMPALTLSTQECQSGRVCINSCYSNGKPISCDRFNEMKFVLFDPPFNETLPSVHLRLVRIDTYDAWFNADVIIRKENFTLHGMNIYFSLLTKSTTDIICVDWHACSLDSI